MPLAVSIALPFVASDSVSAMRLPTLRRLATTNPLQHDREESRLPSRIGLCSEPRARDVLVLPGRAFVRQRGSGLSHLVTLAVPSRLSL